MTLASSAREELARIAPGRATAVTIGKFDGVHRGHQHLIQSLLRAAKDRQLASVVITLHPNPLVVLRPDTPVTYLCALEERLTLLQSLGVDQVGTLSFTPELSQLSAREFVSLLIDELRMKLLFVGPDLALGRRREGDTSVLCALGATLGFELVVAEPLQEDQRKVGSSAVRQALAAGEMEEVSHLLGRPYGLAGPVVQGDKRGRTLGFPTANVAVPRSLALPAFGVYVTRALAGGQSYLASTNIGIRPTFDDGDQLTVEAYLLDFEGDLYGHDLRLEVLHRLRGEARFNSLAALKEAIARDVAATRSYFALAPAPAPGRASA